MAQDGGSRFTAWFSATERAALEKRATDENTTLNYIVRRAVRAYIGRGDLILAAESIDQERSHRVAGVTRNI